MIKHEELLEAIASCQGEKNPNAQTCIKLAAYYTLLNELYGERQPVQMYSFRAGQEQTENTKSVIDYKSGSEFSEAIDGKEPNRIFKVIEELLEAVYALQPRLYDATMRKLKE